MSVSEAERRAMATGEFQKDGVGGKLTRTALMLMDGVARGKLGDSNRWAIAFAAGSIIERVVWQAYGTWMGYFDPMQPISDEEQRFLAEHADLLRELDMPEAVQELGLRLAYLDSATSQEFYRQTFPFWDFRRPIREWFPIFQAMLITAELLHEPVVEPFLLFLQRGDLEHFKQSSPDAEEVFRHLREKIYTPAYLSEQQLSESVLAGFIRFTEYLSAMDGIYPEMDAEPFGEINSTVPSRMIDRDILFSTLMLYRWRAPRGATERFQAVLVAFLELTAAELAKNPAMAVQWSYAETARMITNLSYRFFFQPEAPSSEISGETSDRVRAMEERLQALRKGEPDRRAW